MRIKFSRFQSFLLVDEEGNLRDILLSLPYKKTRAKAQILEEWVELFDICELEDFNPHSMPSFLASHNGEWAILDPLFKNPVPIPADFNEPFYLVFSEGDIFCSLLTVGSQIRQFEQADEARGETGFGRSCVDDIAKLRQYKLDEIYSPSMLDHPAVLDWR